MTLGCIKSHVPQEFCLLRKPSLLFFLVVQPHIFFVILTMRLWRGRSREGKEKKRKVSPFFSRSSRPCVPWSTFSPSARSYVRKIGERVPKRFSRVKVVTRHVYVVLKTFLEILSPRHVRAFFMFSLLSLPFKALDVL